MAEEKFGTAAIEKVISSGLKLGNEIATDLQDKKLSLAEGIGLLDNLMEIPDIVNSVDELENEFNDLSEVEIATVNAKFKTEFDIPNDKVEEQVEAAFYAGTSLVRLIKVFKKPKAGL